MALSHPFMEDRLVLPPSTPLLLPFTHIVHTTSLISGMRDLCLCHPRYKTKVAARSLYVSCDIWQCFLQWILLSVSNTGELSIENEFNRAFEDNILKFLL